MGLPSLPAVPLADLPEQTQNDQRDPTDLDLASDGCQLCMEYIIDVYIYICMGLYGLYMGLYGIIWVIYGIINHLLSGDAHPRSSKWIKIGGPRNVTFFNLFDVDPK